MFLRSEVFEMGCIHNTLDLTCARCTEQKLEIATRGLEELRDKTPLASDVTSDVARMILEHIESVGVS